MITEIRLAYIVLLKVLGWQSILQKKTIAKCINCSPDEIFFTSGGTESDNWALRGVLEATGKKHIITTKIEHAAILETCKDLSKKGYQITYLDVNSKGIVDIDQLKDSITENTGIVSVMHSNNEIGTIQNIKEIAKIVHQKHCFLHTDAVQSIGHIPIDVVDLGIDLLSASAHKFNGPKGIGFLYCSKAVSLSPLLYGGHQQGNMRPGTENVPGIVGMATALFENVSNILYNTRVLQEYEEIIVNRLVSANIHFLRNGSEEKLPGLLSLSFKNVSGEAIVSILSMKKICCSTGSACNSKSLEISHVLKAIKLDEKYAVGTIRISLNTRLTERDIDYLANQLVKTIKSLTETI